MNPSTLNPTHIGWNIMKQKIQYIVFVAIFLSQLKVNKLVVILLSVKALKIGRVEATWLNMLEESIVLIIRLGASVKIS